MAHALTRRASGGRVIDVVTFAAKVIGIGAFAGLMITTCEFLIDACLHGLH